MKQNKERAISIISGEYYEDVLSTLPVTIANNSHVKGNIKAPKVTVGNHVVIEGNIEADNDITIGNMCEIGNMLSDENIFVGQMCIVGKVSAGATAYIMGYSAADSVFGDIDKKLDVGTNEIEFTPQEEGEYIYSCWMNMIKIK